MIPGASWIKHKVSKKKVRFMKDGFDLDLAYITPRMIAMGFPSSGTEAVFRNPANQVRAFIEKYHAGHCKVYNLCIEKKYDASILGLPNDLVEQHGCFDHNPAPLICVQPFCESARQWLEADPKNVVAVHCKAGKGRTGMMLAALMVYMKEHPDSTRALELFGKMRTKNSKGVTIPSQKRYVGYAEQLLLVDQMPLRVPPLYTITKIVLHVPPDVAMDPKTSFTVELVHQQAAVGPRPCQPRDRAPSCASMRPRWASLVLAPSCTPPTRPRCLAAPPCRRPSRRSRTWRRPSRASSRRCGRAGRCTTTRRWAARTLSTRSSRPTTCSTARRARRRWWRATSRSSSRRRRAS